MTTTLREALPATTDVYVCPIATEPTPSPAEQMSVGEVAQFDELSAQDRVAAEVLVRNLFSNSKHRIDGLEYDVAYELAMGAVGGDIVDVYHFDNGNVAFSIADISGKGTQAAIHAALVKYGLRCFASQGLTPERILRSLDRVYIENNAFERTESFASVFTAIVDESRRGFTYCSAGHEGIIVKPPGEKARVLPPTAPIIGVFDDQHHLFKQRYVETKPGTLLVGVTDGITEARNFAGEFFGVEGLLEVIERYESLTPSEISNAILSEVNVFADDSLHDDAAIFVMRVTAIRDTAI